MWKSAYNTKPGDLQEGDKLGTVIVAVIGYVNDWAAYEIEIRPDGSMPDCEQVATNGEKISQQAAERLFPVCRHLKWRD